MRNVKCQHCEVTDTPKDEMEYELVGKAKKVKKYYHKHCYNTFLEEKKFKEIEAKELDELKISIENIFNINQLPHQAYPFLQKLRNGEKVFGNQNTGKRYKEGYSYPLIKDTFEYCEDTINYWLKNKEFKGFMSAFKYSLSIVIDKIYFVEQRVAERKSREAVSERKEKSRNQEYQSTNFNEKKFGKKTDDMDISELL